MNKKSTQTSATAPEHPYTSPQIKLVDINVLNGPLATSDESDLYEIPIVVDPTAYDTWI